VITSPVAVGWTQSVEEVSFLELLRRLDEMSEIPKLKFDIRHSEDRVS